MIVTPVRPTYYEQLKECAAKPHVKLATAITLIFATSLIPLQIFPTLTKFGQIAVIAGASAGWGVFFNYYYQKPLESIVLA